MKKKRALKKPVKKVKKRPTKRPVKKLTKKPKRLTRKPVKRPTKKPARKPIRKPKLERKVRRKPEVRKPEVGLVERRISGKTDVYFNGRVACEIKNPADFVENLIKKRRMGLISHQMNIAYYPDFNEVRVNTTHGRTRRPLIIVDNGKPKLTDKILKKLNKGEINWSYLIQHGI
ncbi:MAG: hypothetical protein GTN76_10980, partial [Candidatus Aenigmarchaeota archaeon]|nr:hypothetical protein [Candidatus Aenigmarchaeota archaeon]NIO22959.1 hypothetical protein [Candidatus Aenigmarchaeota archaeon]